MGCWGYMARGFHRGSGVWGVGPEGFRTGLGLNPSPKPLNPKP